MTRWPSGECQISNDKCQMVVFCPFYNRFNPSIDIWVLAFDIR
ncbi:hypothetical protein DESC_10049 [Desulfosarcina cetonica]|nr:hypothetical protein DESC_10049 [Desulfosarcina cetonica]